MLDGVVTLAEPDLFYTGGTLIFDHGHGISTLYMHIKTLMVKKGQKVKQGDVYRNCWLNREINRSTFRC